MAGAGISTSAGIPDFRSPGTGLYSNLQRLNLPYPEAVFDISYFEEHPEPFYALAKELQPGKYRPTVTHSFIRLLSDKGLLHTCFTQNIDTLERRAGVPVNKLVEAHGSFATHACIKCHRSYPDDKMNDAVATQRVPHCERCKGLVKPNIVFFGESLPNEFILRIPDLESADLLIIIGTSLTVEPFARLATFVDETCPRLLLNLEAVGGIGKRPNDVLRLGHCDDSVRELCAELGWAEELEELWKSTDILGQGQGEKESKVPDSVEKKGDRIPSKIETLAKHLEDALKISESRDSAIQKSEKDEGAEPSINVGKGAEKVDDSNVPDVVTSVSPGRVNV